MLVKLSVWLEASAIFNSLRGLKLQCRRTERQSLASGDLFLHMYVCTGAYLSCFLVARKPPLHQEGEGLIEPRPRVINTANASHFSIIQQPVANEAFVVLLDSFLYPSCPKPCPCMSLVSYSFHPRMLSLISGRGFAKFRRALCA